MQLWVHWLYLVKVVLFTFYLSLSLNCVHKSLLVRLVPFENLLHPFHETVELALDILCLSLDWLSSHLHLDLFSQGSLAINWRHSLTPWVLLGTIFLSKRRLQTLPGSLVVLIELVNFSIRLVCFQMEWLYTQSPVLVLWARHRFSLKCQVLTLTFLYKSI